MLFAEDSIISTKKRSIHLSSESDIRTYCRIIPYLQSGLKVRRICVGNPFAGMPQELGDSVLEKRFGQVKMRKSVLLIERGVFRLIFIVKNVGVNPPRDPTKLSLIRISINNEEMTVRIQDALNLAQTVQTVFSTERNMQIGHTQHLCCGLTTVLIQPKPQGY